MSQELLPVKAKLLKLMIFYQLICNTNDTSPPHRNFVRGIVPDHEDTDVYVQYEAS